MPQDRKECQANPDANKHTLAELLPGPDPTPPPKTPTPTNKNNGNNMGGNNGNNMNNRNMMVQNPFDDPMHNHPSPGMMQHSHPSPGMMQHSHPSPGMMQMGMRHCGPGMGPVPQGPPHQHGPHCGCGSMHPGMMHGPGGPGKVYPPNQPMVFNPSNPNAPPIYPCGVCHKEVHENDQAILCESGCNFWFHRMCTGLTELAFTLLKQEVYAEWVCDLCIKTKVIPLVKYKP